MGMRSSGVGYTSEEAGYGTTYSTKNHLFLFLSQTISKRQKTSRSSEAACLPADCGGGGSRHSALVKLQRS